MAQSVELARTLDRYGSGGVREWCPLTPNQPQAFVLDFGVNATSKLPARPISNSWSTNTDVVYLKGGSTLVDFTIDPSSDPILALSELPKW